MLELMRTADSEASLLYFHTPVLLQPQIAPFFFAIRVMTVAIFDKPVLATRKSFDKTDNSFVIFRNVI
ncbi:hypothetical protein EDM56_10760 [Brevibacillus fluminis]|uniref:Uncharacterized protein n=1 Tax=Brevibacillus fluminis TaxID=511487 RepID=A0A3M8DNH5_9BACL|nr:hypothetical protein EDM56_10760 [Brevibacillus fluminis]